jgi:lipopolysaccharide transport system permease protein
MQNEQDWDHIITPKKALLNINIREIIRYRDLVFLLFRRDFTTLYKQTILGPLWFILNPLFSTIVYTLVFTNFAKIGTDGIPPLLFYYGGTMLWTYFSACFIDISDTFTTNSGIFGKVYFPRLVPPISRIFTNLSKSMIQFATLICFYIYFFIEGSAARPQIWAIAFPLIFAWIAMLASGLGMIITSVTTRYRDLKQLVSFGVQLFMYATPIVYPLSAAPERYRWVFYINPMSAPVELFRIWFYGYGTVPQAMILSSVGFTIIAFIIGLIIFNQNEGTFLDII